MSKLLYPLQDFKDVRGAYKTEALFCETISAQSQKTYKPMYTLKDYPHRGLPSAFEIYSRSTDEYDAAMNILGSYSHWKKLCSLKWFMEGKEGVFRGVKHWREEMKQRDISLAKKTLMEQVEEGSVSAASALLRLAESKNSKGRPKKEKDTSSHVPSHLVDHVINFNKR